MKTKKAIIVVSLVDESSEKTDEELEKEIYRELSRDFERSWLFPWCKKVEKVTVKQ